MNFTSTVFIKNDAIIYIWINNSALDIWLVNMHPASEQRGVQQHFYPGLKSSICTHGNLILKTIYKICSSYFKAYKIWYQIIKNNLKYEYILIFEIYLIRFPWV